jgi:hypothetical protein
MELGGAARAWAKSLLSYLPPQEGREIAAAYVTAFFRATLGDDAGAEAYLTSQRLGVLGEFR